MGNTAIKGVVHSAGLEDDDIDRCIDGEVFTPWVTTATQRALQGPLPNTEVESVDGTPTILVNGNLYSGSLNDATAFRAFLQEQAAD